MDEVTLLIYPEGSSRFDLYEDDGRTNAYRSGARADRVRVRPRPRRRDDPDRRGRGRPIRDPGRPPLRVAGAHGGASRRRARRARRAAPARRPARHARRVVGGRGGLHRRPPARPHPPTRRGDAPDLTGGPHASRAQDLKNQVSVWATWGFVAHRAVPEPLRDVAQVRLYHSHPLRGGRVRHDRDQPYLCRGRSSTRLWPAGRAPHP